ncbi:MAG: deoxynucleoside kinase [Candidatus Woesearchaeota archaeon]
MSVGGPLAAGKSLFGERAANPAYRDILLDILGEDSFIPRKISVLEEITDDALRSQFYGHEDTMAFPFQISCFTERIKRDALAATTEGIVILLQAVESDRWVYGEGNRENMGALFSVYGKLYDQVYPRLTPSDVYIYLRVKEEEVGILQERIRKRGRPEECSLLDDSSYLVSLIRSCDHLFFDVLKDKPVVVVEAGQMDLDAQGNVTPEHALRTLTRVAREIKQRGLVPTYPSGLKKWLEYSPPEAVLRYTEVEEDLKHYLSKNQICTTILGNISSGKSTWAQIFSRRLGIVGSFELNIAANNTIGEELLAQFVRSKDPEDCYKLQEYRIGKFMDTRQVFMATRRSFVEDKDPVEDPGAFHPLFLTQGLLTQDQYEELQQRWKEAGRKGPHSDMMILLQSKPELCYQRMHQRGRAEETEGEGWKLERDLRPLDQRYRILPTVARSYGLIKAGAPILQFDVDVVDVTNDVYKGYVFERILTALRQYRT